MAPPSEKSPCSALLSSIGYWGILAAATLLPLAVHIMTGWWAGLLVWMLLVKAYVKLYVPETSLCMGIPFAGPMASLTALPALDLRPLLAWLRS